MGAVSLNFPVPSAPLALTTDASQYAMGAVLDQFVDGAWRPLGFWSKKFNKNQQSYTTFKRELLSIKFAMRHFNKDFNGRSLVVFTDHRPILGCFGSNNLQAHDAVALNAISEIGQWTRDIRHKDGRSNIIADMLSRPSMPVGSAYEVEDISSISAPEYVAPEKTIAALQEIALISCIVQNKIN